MNLIFCELHTLKVESYLKSFTNRLSRGKFRRHFKKFQTSLKLFNVSWKFIRAYKKLLKASNENFYNYKNWKLSISSWDYLIKTFTKNIQFLVNDCQSFQKAFVESFHKNIQFFEFFLLKNHNYFISNYSSFIHQL